MIDEEILIPSALSSVLVIQDDLQFREQIVKGEEETALEERIAIEKEKLQPQENKKEKIKRKTNLIKTERTRNAGQTKGRIFAPLDSIKYFDVTKHITLVPSV